MSLPLTLSNAHARSMTEYQMALVTDKPLDNKSDHAVNETEPTIDKSNLQRERLRP